MWCQTACATVLGTGIHSTPTHEAAWTQELALHAELFEQLAYHLPQELVETRLQLEKRLAA